MNGLTMKTLSAMLPLLAALLSAAWAGQNAQPFAVVELFGSEGCSSCPPADNLLRELTSQARSGGKRIFTLSFHVDYWNNLGWPDPFSSAQFTRRQRQYAGVLRSSSVYTPQMIINGAEAFVGSDAALAGKYIDQYLRRPPSNTVALEVKNKGPQQITAAYHCGQLNADTVINFALVERGLESNVTAGENAGRVLKHDNVVREFKTMPFTQKEGSVFFAKPAAEDLSKFSIIAYLQNKNDMKIIAADSVDLGGPGL